jgi:hypothetical protein
MNTARIVQRENPGAESGTARRNQWEITFEPAEARVADPLTGWAGSGDPQHDQVRLRFATPEDAVAYCEKQGWDYRVIPAGPKRIKLQSYADNFR